MNQRYVVQAPPFPGERRQRDIDDGASKTARRARQIMEILIASDGLGVTYGDLGRMIGHPARYFGPPLTLIADNCAQNGLPPLHCLAVSRSGDPGGGYGAGPGGVEADRRAVREFDWHQIALPSAQDLDRTRPARRLLSHAVPG